LPAAERANEFAAYFGLLKDVVNPLTTNVRFYIF
jgi:hypothetical protein